MKHFSSVLLKPKLDNGGCLSFWDQYADVTGMHCLLSQYLNYLFFSYSHREPKVLL